MTLTRVVYQRLLKKRIFHWSTTSWLQWESFEGTKWIVHNNEVPVRWGSFTEHTWEPFARLEVDYLLFVFHPSDISSFLNQLRRAWSTLRTARKLANNTTVVSKKETPSNTNRGAKIFHTMRWRRCRAAEQHVAKSWTRNEQISNKNFHYSVTILIKYMCADLTTAY